MASDVIITGCKLSIPVYSCDNLQPVYSCVNTILAYSCNMVSPVHACVYTSQPVHSCNVRDWVWFDTSDYYMYGYSSGNRYSYLKESGHRVY